MASQPEIITSLFAFRRRARDDDELVHFRADHDRNFLDELCREIHSLPTMCAAVTCTPALSEVPIIAAYWENGFYGKHSSRGVEINVAHDVGETRDTHFDLQLTTMPHELRHHYQVVKGCMELVEHPRVKMNLEDHILFDRVAEADATAFSLTVMYELSLLRGYDEPMQRAREVHNGSVEAYLDAVAFDNNAHWNGKAAHAAFEAYFYRDNSSHLKDYDLELCDDFLKAVQSGGAERHSLNIPQNMRYDLITDYLKPLSRMPFVSRGGKIIQRNHYRPGTCDNVMDYLSPEAQDCIERARHILTVR